MKKGEKKRRTISDVLDLRLDEDFPFELVDLTMVFVDDFQSLIDNYKDHMNRHQYLREKSGTDTY